MQIFTSLTTQSIYLCMYVKLKVQFKNTIFHNRHTQPEVEHSAPVLAFPEFLYYIAGQRTCPDHPPRSRQLHPCLCKHPSHSKQKYQSVLNIYCQGTKFTDLMGILLYTQIKVFTCITIFINYMTLYITNVLSNNKIYLCTSEKIVSL